MAKLDGVNVVDMNNGEITKIAHYGVEYTKVDGEASEVAKVGDIAYVANSRTKYFDGESYYKSVKFWDSGNLAFKDNYDTLTAFSDMDKRVTLYRKLAQPPKVSQPFAEMITSKVDAVEKRVAALEDAKGNGDTPELNVGDQVKALANGEFRDIKRGEYGVIVEMTEFADTSEFYIEVKRDYDDMDDFFRPQDLELASQVTPIPTVGDIVVITGNTNGSRNKVGDIGKVVEHKYNDSFTVAVDVPQRPYNGTGNFTKFNEMRIATDAEKAEYEKAVEQAEKDAVFTKAGRKLNEYRKGDLVRIKAEFHTGSRNKPGDIGEITECYESGYYVDVHARNRATAYGNHHVDRNLEIVCFAEDRADAVAKGGR